MSSTPLHDPTLRAPSVAALAIAVAPALSACARTAEQARIEPTAIQVTLLGETGAEEAPLAFSAETVSWTIQVQTLDKDGEPYPFEGDLSLRVRPGKLDQEQWISLSGGTWEGEVAFHSAFGPTRIWVSDEGDKDSGSGRAPSFATGVTEAIHYAFPTLAEMNRIDDHETNQLAGEFAELRVADRQVVVTAVGTAGFWVTDTMDPAGSYNSLFIYSFSKPSGIEPGSRLSLLTGGTQEYLATTQLNFPEYEAVEGETLPVPEPVEIEPDTACDENLMEALESSLVVARDLVIPADFVEGTEDYDDYIAYGQWPVDFQSGGCRMYVDSAVADPDFHPTEHAGENLAEVEGLLYEVWGKWILGALSGGDVGGGIEDDRQQADPSPHQGLRPLLRPPTPRPRPGTAPAAIRPSTADPAPAHDHAH